MPRSIFWGEISCVELPSPASRLDVPTSVIPACSSQGLGLSQGCSYHDVFMSYEGGTTLMSGPIQCV